LVAVYGVALPIVTGAVLHLLALQAGPSPRSVWFVVTFGSLFGVALVAGAADGGVGAGASARAGNAGDGSSSEQVAGAQSIVTSVGQRHLALYFAGLAAVGAVVLGTVA
jgi:hypothetical protein